MKKQTFIFFASVVILIIVSSYILISSTEKKVPVTSSGTVESEVEDMIEIPKGLPGPKKYSINVGLRINSRGELIRFDSTYAEYFKSSLGGTNTMDSLINKINRLFVPVISQRFEQLFFDDSNLYIDFFHRDFFRQRYALNKNYMEKMMMEMDSLKNNFYMKNQRLKKL